MPLLRGVDELDEPGLYAGTELLGRMGSRSGGAVPPQSAGGAGGFPAADVQDPGSEASKRGSTGAARPVVPANLTRYARPSPPTRLPSRPHLVGLIPESADEPAAFTELVETARASYGLDPDWTSGAIERAREQSQELVRLFG